jgi:hypothetical protein
VDADRLEATRRVGFGFAGVAVLSAVVMTFSSPRLAPENRS